MIMLKTYSKSQWHAFVRIWTFSSYSSGLRKIGAWNYNKTYFYVIFIKKKLIFLEIRLNFYKIIHEGVNIFLYFTVFEI